MKIQQNIILQLLLSGGLLYSLSSCVSASKYDALAAEKALLEVKVDSLQKVLDKITASELRLRKERNDLTSENSDLSTKKAALEKELGAVKRELSDLTTAYNALKNNSSDEQNKLAEQLSEAQKILRTREARLKEIEAKLAARDSANAQLRAKIQKALLAFKDSDLSISIRNGKVYVSMSNQLLFASGSTAINKKGKEALRNIAEALNTQPDINIEVEGHTDNVPISGGSQFKDNWDLSVLRSTEVIRYLTIDGGIDPKRITASGRGEYFPIEEGNSNDSRAKNRRTEIMLTPKLSELFDLLK